MTRVPLTPHERQGILSVILIAAVITLVGILGKYVSARKEVPSHPQIEVLSADTVHNDADTYGHKKGSRGSAASKEDSSESSGKDGRKSGKKNSKNSDRNHSTDRRTTTPKRSAKPAATPAPARSHLDESNI